MRGDRPIIGLVKVEDGAFTPHARGSTLVADKARVHFVVYPACAGIDLDKMYGGVLAWSLPRMRGDRPLGGKGRNLSFGFTPHARGSTTFSSVVLLGG